MRTRMLAACLSLTLSACGTEPSESPTRHEHDSTGDVQAALAALSSAEVVGSHDDGVPFMIKGRLGAAQGLAAGSSLSDIAAVFRLRSSDLVRTRSHRDEQGHTHTRYGQTKNGLPVVGGELILHQDTNGLIYAANGSARDGERAPSSPLIASDAARLTALNTIPGRHLETEGEPRLVYVRSNQDDKLKLAYEVVVTGEGETLPIRDHVFVNAVSGAVELRDSDIHTALNRNVSSSKINDPVARLEGAPPTGDMVVDTTYDNLGETYNCYKTLFNRDSYDNAGAQINAKVHYGTNYVNASWTGTQILFGDGDGVRSLPLGLDKDMTTHEFTHAVTQYESNLVYSRETGGLNESMSDIFASVCASWASGTWSTDPDIYKLGEDVWTPGTEGDAVRYMDDPAKDGASIDYWSSGVGVVDVHYSSGIGNLAYALLSKGGTHPRGKSTTVVTGIGVEKAGRIFYKANTDYFTMYTLYAEAKTYTQQAATALGYTPAEIDSVAAAWEAVGVGVVPPAVALSNGVAKTGLGAPTGGALSYYLDVPANKASSFVMSGGSGNADLYVKAGAMPTTTSYDCRPNKSGNAETCSIAAKTVATRIYVVLRASSTFSSVSLKGTY
ncbi:peptidase M4 family protein [Cystobacter fuscus]|uniref:M4 family metallopeptidase n=1 Tax=Cystobacter fuscus TaxID=43 RepID=UPI002B2B59A2|nr:peptidase M4 family protein [Cystobacter fuscus]